MNQEQLSELKYIASQHDGLLRPVDVVEAAKDPTSALHSAFTWDDTEAARLHRLNEARALIRVTVEYMGPSDETREYRVFISLPEDRKNPGGGYRDTRVVLGDQDYRAQLLAEARLEMERFQAKYASLNILCNVFDAMQATEKKLRRRRAETKPEVRV